MAGSITVSTISNDTGVFATQNAVTGIAKAWVLYNATTQTIVNSFNVSSVTYDGTGQFTVNFATAMPNANYSPQIFAGGISSSAPYIGLGATGTTVNNISFYTQNGSTNLTNYTHNCVTIFSS